MSDNWVVQNLQSTLGTWNKKLAEIWTMLNRGVELSLNTDTSSSAIYYAYSPMEMP